MIDIGKVGIWHFFETQPAAKLQEAAAELEELGFKVVWMPEAVGREVMTAAGLLLAATRKIVIATGIANIWARDAMTMAAAQKTLCEAYPNRFLLGVGVSHAPMVQDLRGHRYDKPLSYMRSYLDAMDKALYVAPMPAGETPRVIGALAPKMLKLSAERAGGAHPYFVPPEHTAHARSILGKGPLLAPEQAAVLETDPSKARAIARDHMGMYLSLPNYVNNLKRLGFADADVENGGSNRLVDAIVVWGSIDDVVGRVRAHHDAGADHVCLQMLGSDPTQLPRSQWRELASALLG